MGTSSGFPRGHWVISASVPCSWALSSQEQHPCTGGPSAWPLLLALLPEATEGHLTTFPPRIKPDLPHWLVFLEPPQLSQPGWGAAAPRGLRCPWEPPRDSGATMGFYLRGETGAARLGFQRPHILIRPGCPASAPLEETRAARGCRRSLPGFENENGQTHPPPQSLTGARLPRSFQKAPWSPWGVWRDPGDLSAGTWGRGCLAGPGHSTPAVVSSFQ